MMLSLQSAGIFPSRMIAFIKFAIILQQISKTAFNISAITPKVQPLSYSLCTSGISTHHQDLLTVLDQQQDQHVEGFETTETQYLSNIRNVVSLLAYLVCHQVKDYHHHLVYISLRLHPDLMYAFVWRHERCFLYCL